MPKAKRKKRKKTAPRDKRKNAPLASFPSILDDQTPAVDAPERNQSNLLHHSTTDKTNQYSDPTKKQENLGFKFPNLNGLQRNFPQLPQVFLNLESRPLRRSYDSEQNKNSNDCGKVGETSCHSRRSSSVVFLLLDLLLVRCVVVFF